jgi:glycosyltransferase involved in cell wall biosynthesis
VIGADIAGIREIIDESNAGVLFDSGNKKELEEKILLLWNDGEKCSRLKIKCRSFQFMEIDEYCQRMLNGIYAGEIKDEYTDHKDCTRRNLCR